MTDPRNRPKKMPPAVAPAEGVPSVQISTRGNVCIAKKGVTSKVDVAIAFASSSGRVWRYKGKRGRVLAMLAETKSGITQWDTLPWHTRLGGTVHVLRRDGLSISTELEGEYRHARYRLATPGRLLLQGENREAAA